MSTIIKSILGAIMLIALSLSLFAASTEFPSGSLANQVVTAVNQVNAKSSATRATGATAVPTILTAVEALDNTTTIPINQLVGIEENLQAFRFLSDAIALRVDTDIPLVKAIIANHVANKIP